MSTDKRLLTASKQSDQVLSAEVRAVFKAAGIRYTRQRAILYEVLNRSEKPLTAKSLLAASTATKGQRAEEGAGLWLSTVYRTLELFCEKGLVDKTIKPNDDQPVYILRHDHHEHFAICTSCNRVFDIVSCPGDVWAAELAGLGFQMTGHRAEVYGLCADCRKKQSDETESEGGAVGQKEGDRQTK